MYSVIYRNDFTGNFSVLAGPFSTLEEAIPHRKVNGDLIVDQDYKPVQSYEWLFSWEKECEEPTSSIWQYHNSKSSYAKCMIFAVKHCQYRVGNRLNPRRRWRVG